MFAQSDARHLKNRAWPEPSRAGNLSMFESMWHDKLGQRHGLLGQFNAPFRF